MNHTSFTRIKLSVFVPLFICANECGSVAPAANVRNIDQAVVLNRGDLPAEALVAAGYSAPEGWQEIIVGKQEAYLLNAYFCPQCAKEIMAKLQKALSD